MSDDVFNIPTPFADVAALGQGYAMRADGEYLWVPLPQPLEVGTSVQFLVTLADGTPAFAGAGQCVQVSDTGEEAHPQVRFETALGALQFDERSQPVYDYLVAVRAAAMEAQAAEAGGAEAVAAEPGAEAAELGGDEVQQVSTAEVQDAATDYADYAGAADDAVDHGSYAAPETEGAEDPAALAEAGEYAEQAAEAGAPDGTVGTEGTEADYAGYDTAEPGAGDAEGHQYAQEAAEVDADGLAAVDSDGLNMEPAETLAQPSSTPSVIPTGMLSRPAIALGWKPAPARAPQPSAGSGLFAYAQGALPVPELPPRPDLDPSLWVQPAPRPGAQAAQTDEHASEAQAEVQTDGEPALEADAPSAYDTAEDLAPDAGDSGDDDLDELGADLDGMDADLEGLDASATSSSDEGDVAGVEIDMAPSDAPPAADGDTDDVEIDAASAENTADDADDVEIDAAPAEDDADDVEIDAAPAEDDADDVEIDAAPAEDTADDTDEADTTGAPAEEHSGADFASEAAAEPPYPNGEGELDVEVQ